MEMFAEVFAEHIHNLPRLLFIIVNYSPDGVIHIICSTDRIPVERKMMMLHEIHCNLM